MWPFSRRARLDSDTIARVEALERRLKSIEIEWDEWYDKYRRLYARLAKRTEREEQAPESPSEPRSNHKGREITNPLARAILGGRSDAVLPTG